ncbi:hypothetical protein HY493_05840 [Candidatus Woesearchaeota archaeon]|nr:hypothetical protein [Candidatus Woesearchaeota archaeon]
MIRTFGLAITAEDGANGSLERVQVRSQSHGLSEESIITIVRTWLRNLEDNYRDEYLGRSA